MNCKYVVLFCRFDSSYTALFDKAAGVLLSDKCVRVLKASFKFISMNKTSSIDMQLFDNYSNISLSYKLRH